MSPAVTVGLKMIVRMLEVRLGFCYGTISFPDAAILLVNEIGCGIIFCQD